MVERRSGEVAVPLSTKKIFKRVVPTNMQTAVRSEVKGVGSTRIYGSICRCILRPLLRLCTEEGRDQLWESVQLEFPTPLGGGF